MFCQFCGTQIPEGDEFCGQCGARTPGAPGTPPSAAPTGASAEGARPGDPLPTFGAPAAGGRQPWRAAYFDRDPNALPHESEYAGFWIRFAAWLLDAIFVVLMGIIPAVIAYLAFWSGNDDSGFQSFDEQRNANNAAEFAASMVFFIIWFLYQLVFTARGATWGKSICSLRVVKIESGAVPGLETAAVRVGVLAVLNLVSQGVGLVESNPIALLVFPIALAFLLNYLWPIWDQDKQTFHDKAAGTVVIRV